jgi:hypothetical protein
MGDRGNIFIVDNSAGSVTFQGTESVAEIKATLAAKALGGRSKSTGIYFYSHWNGSDLPFVVQRALARKHRWDDGPYLARIIFCELVKGDESSETGFGISTGICDNSHPVVTVDPGDQTVSFNGNSWSFESYIVLDERQIEQAYERDGDAERTDGQLHREVTMVKLPVIAPTRGPHAKKTKLKKGASA